MGQEIAKTNQPAVPGAKVLNLSAVTQLDLSRLTPDQVAELERQHAQGMIDLNRKANELRVENLSLTDTLETLNTQASKATQSNVSMTATHTQTNTTGRTEVMIGNTERAAAGKLSASATGAQDRTLWVVGIIAAAAVFVALLASRH
jgi:hypothetical protein